MIKRIVFDVDDTLIDFKEEYWDSISKAFKDFNIILSKQQYDKICGIYNKYEKNVIKFNIKELIDIISKRMNIDLPNGLSDRILFYFSKCYPKNIDKELKETIKYLSLKYELVILSNFYTTVQKERLDNIGIGKYFIEFYGYDTDSYKPLDSSYFKAIKNYSVEECAFVGDNYIHDYKKPSSLGMKSYLLDKENKYKVKNRINKISELKNIL